MTCSVHLRWPGEHLEGQKARNSFYGTQERISMGLPRLPGQLFFLFLRQISTIESCLQRLPWDQSAYLPWLSLTNMQSPARLASNKNHWCGPAAVPQLSPKLAIHAGALPLFCRTSKSIVFHRLAILALMGICRNPHRIDWLRFREHARRRMLAVREITSYTASSGGNS